MSVTASQDTPSCVHGDKIWVFDKTSGHLSSFGISTAVFVPTNMGYFDETPGRPQLCLWCYFRYF